MNTKEWILRILSIKVTFKSLLFVVLCSNIFWIYFIIRSGSNYSSYRIRDVEGNSPVKRSSAYNVTKSPARIFSNTSRVNLNKNIDAYSYHERSSADIGKRARARLFSNLSLISFDNRNISVRYNNVPSNAYDLKRTHVGKFSNSSLDNIGNSKISDRYNNKSSAHNFTITRAGELNISPLGSHNRNSAVHYKNKSSAYKFKRARLPHQTKAGSRFLGAHKLGRREKAKRNDKFGFRRSKYLRNNAKYPLYLQQWTQKHESPMMRVLRSLGVHFGKYVEDPRLRELHDFRTYHTPQYLDRYKNPCFIKAPKTTNKKHKQVRMKLRCVPYFMMAGFPKCGTTDMWFRLQQHPAVVLKHKKEVNFFHRKQYDFLSIEEAMNNYQLSFSLSAREIRTCEFKKNGTKWPCITGDASVDTIFDNKLWKLLPGNENLTEPALTNANYVHKVNPNMKIIVLVRDPVERLYSDYLYMSGIGYTPNPKEFHDIVLKRIHVFQACRKNQTLRACTYDVYDDWNSETYKVRLTVGIYHVFLSDWLRVFPRSNILVVKSENTKGIYKYLTLSEIFNFLGLPIPSRGYLEHFYNGTVYKNKRSDESENMLPQTRTILQEFYKEFNQQLEKLFPHIHY